MTLLPPGAHSGRDDDVHTYPILSGLVDTDEFGRVPFSSFVQLAMYDVVSRLRPPPDAYSLGVLTRSHVRSILSFQLLRVSEPEPRHHTSN